MASLQHSHDVIGYNKFDFAFKTSHTDMFDVILFMKQTLLIAYLHFTSKQKQKYIMLFTMKRAHQSKNLIIVLG